MAQENAAKGAHRPVPRLLAVSKTQSATAVAALAAAGCRLLGSVVLTPAAAAALDRLTADGQTIDGAVCAALLLAAGPADA